LRYVDDLLVLGDSKEELWVLRESVRGRLAALRLQLHPAKSQVMRTDRKVDGLAYQVVPGRRWLRGENVRRAARRVRVLQRNYTQGSVSLQDALQSLRAVRHAPQAPGL
jgi:RNA-directed DNA polymerase